MMQISTPVVTDQPTVQCKVSYGDEVRRFSHTGASFVPFEDTLRRLFKLADLPKFRVAYKDEEGDLITISSDLEFQTAISINPQAISRFFIILAKDSHYSCSREGGDFQCRPRGHCPKKEFRHRRRGQFKQEKLALKQAAKEIKQSHKIQEKGFKEDKKKLSWQEKKAMKEEKARLKDQKKEMKKQKKLERAQAKALEREMFNVLFIDDPNQTGNPIPPNTLFTPVFKLRNVGTQEWPEGTQLVRIGKTDPSGIQSQESISVPKAVKPGEEVDVSITMKAPAQPGSYACRWRLRLASGKNLGKKTVVKIVVAQLYPIPSFIQAEPSAPVQEKWAPAISALESMGFSRSPAMMQLLDRHNGDVNTVAGALCL